MTFQTDIGLLIVTLVQIVITSLMVVYTVRTQRKVQAADTSIRCQERYEALLDTRSAINTPEEAERFYDRLWGAQADQFVHWRNGFIPDETYAEWLKHRRHQARKNSQLAGRDFMSSWITRYSERYKDNPFGELMHAILTQGDIAEPLSDHKHVRKTMSKFRK